MKESGISVNKHIYNILSKDSSLNKLVGKNIFPLIAEEETTFPFIVFKRNSLSPNYAKYQVGNDTVNFSVYIVSNNYANTIDIAEAVRNSLELHRDEYFQIIQMENITEDFIENSYIQEISFSAIITV